MKWLGKKSSDHRSLSREASGKEQSDCPELQNLQVCSDSGESPRTVTCQAHIWVEIPGIPVQIPGIPTGFNTPKLL